MQYPSPALFKDIFETTDNFNNQTNRWLLQVALQAEFGKIVLAFILERLQAGDRQNLQLLPLPKTILTEDGFEFTLSDSRRAFEAGGDLIIELEEVLELMSLSCKNRSQELLPDFRVKTWTSGRYSNYL